MATAADMTPGIVVAGNVFCKDRRPAANDISEYGAIRGVLIDPRVDIAVLNVQVSDLTPWKGLPISVSAFVRSPMDASARSGMAIERLISRAPMRIVMNADDDAACQLASYCDSPRLCYVTQNPMNTRVRAHIENGGKACVLANRKQFLFHDAGAIMPLCPASLLHISTAGSLDNILFTELFAASIAFMLGWSVTDIGKALNSS